MSPHPGVSEPNRSSMMPSIPDPDRREPFEAAHARTTERGRLGGLSRGTPAS